MSVKALSAVFEDSQATGKAFTALLAMADWADHNGWCHPSYSQIAVKARMSRAKAIEAVQELIALGEIERRAKGHAPSDSDHDDDPASIRSQYRNEYRILLIKPKKVVQSDDHLRSAEVGQPLDHIDPPQVVQSHGGGSPDSGAKVVQNHRSHIRIRPSDLTTVRSVRPSGVPGGVLPSAAAASFDPQNPIDQFVLDWNELTTDPIKRVLSLTKKRRQRIRACLTAHDRTFWRDVFARINRSNRCRGQNRDGWILGLDWLTKSEDNVLQVVEGNYDNPKPYERPFTAQEISDARRVRANAMGCVHDTPCADHTTCIAVIIRKWRAEAVAS
jgi:hypothetical protein